MDLSMPAVNRLPTPAPRSQSVLLLTKSKSPMTAAGINGEKKRIWATTFNLTKPRLVASPKLISLTSTTKSTVPKTTPSPSSNTLANSVWQPKPESMVLERSELYPKTAELIPEYKTLSEISKLNYSVDELQKIRQSVGKEHLYFNWEKNAEMTPLVNQLRNLGIYYDQHNRGSTNQRFAELPLWRSQR